MSLSNIKSNNEFGTSIRMLGISSLFLLLLLITQTISNSIEHHNYQKSLMNSVTDRILSDYQEYFTQLRLTIDLQQQKQGIQLKALAEQGKSAKKEEYDVILKNFKKSLIHSRLFAFIEPNGNGSLSHITGEFLPACQEEIAQTIESGKQEKIFLHRGKSSIHFDLLQPLLTHKNENKLLFVAFNADVLKNLLEKYQLPHQELFLMRSDDIGKIELTSDINLINYSQMTISLEELTNFEYVKDIKGTRWQVAIRLDSKYSSMFFAKGLIKALLIWLLLTLIIYLYYRKQMTRSIMYSVIKKKLAYSHDIDKLTGLYNRIFFASKITDLINERSENISLSKGIVIHLDVDQFQVINNNFGYDVGDKYLNIISRKLIEYSASNATVSRLGNDEFAILMPELSHDQAITFAENVKKVISDIDIDELNLSTELTASVGIVMLDTDQQNNEQVFSSLAQALALAKEKGRNRVQLYQSDDESLIQHANDMNAVHELSSALKENRLVLYRQEIRALGTVKKTKSFEVLVRMRNQDNDIISPFYFIPAAEKYGLIMSLDFWVISHTFKMMANSTDDTNTRYSINLSGLTIANKDLYTFVKKQFETYQVKPERICFEITETTAITHLDQALFFMEEMSEIGCTFALDDFGSGLSSFNYLQSLPVHIIKIDGCFITDINTNAINKIFVENIQRTVNAMGKQTVAEYVETAEVESTLHKIGIDFVQGYHIHKPEPWFEFTHYKTNT